MEGEEESERVILERNDDCGKLMTLKIEWGDTAVNDVFLVPMLLSLLLGGGKMKVHSPSTSLVDVVNAALRGR